MVYILLTQLAECIASYLAHVLTDRACKKYWKFFKRKLMAAAQIQRLLIRSTETREQTPGKAYVVGQLCS
jgi:hypothetical protein